MPKYTIEFDFEKEFAKVATLSPRELEIFTRYGMGTLQLKEISTQLGLSPKTVESHVTRARVKLGLRTTIEVRAMAARFTLMKQLLHLDITTKDTRILMVTPAAV